MKAVAYYQSLPIDHHDALQDVQLAAPTPGPRDLLVEVKAISVNPVDTKIRRSVAPEDGAAKVLGWDASGIVQAVGSEVSLFQPGDRVYYAGAINRAGANSELHVVSSYVTHGVSAAIDFSNIDLDTINANSAQYHQEKLSSLELEQLVDNNKNHVLAGIPEQAIPNVTKQINAQLVVLGSVSRKGISAALIGNTVESVLAELNCEVLVVKHKAL